MEFHQPHSTNDFDDPPTHMTPPNFDKLWNDAL